MTAGATGCTLRAMEREVEVRERRADWLGQYATVSISFEVRSMLEPVLKGAGLAGIEFVERSVRQPWHKDYDVLPDNHPTAWAQRFDLTNWGILSAHREGALVGGAVVAFRTLGVDMLQGREDLAVVWDLRVSTEARGRGVGAALFEAAERWAATRGARWLKIETQNVNVAACRFYAARGCELGGIDRFAYPDLPDEVQLMWFKRLSG